MFLNETIKLSLNDYQKYIHPVLAESYMDIGEYSTKFLGLYNQHKNAENILEKEIYSLFELICSLDSGILSDITENHIIFLQNILEKIDNQLVQARIADILCSIKKENKNENAKIAINAYENLLKNPEIFPINKKTYIERILSLSNFINKNDRKNNIKKIEEFLIQEKENVRVILKIIVLLVNEKESDKKLLTSIIEEKRKDSGNWRDQWEEVAKFYSKLGNHQEVENCKISRAEAWFSSAEGADLESTIFALQTSLQIYPNTKKTEGRRKEISDKLSSASAKVQERMQMITRQQMITRHIIEKSEKIKKEISGLNFFEALQTLVSFIKYPSIEELERSLEREKQSFRGIMLFSNMTSTFKYENVNEQSRCESQNLQGKGGMAYYFLNSYFPDYFISELLPIQQGLEIIRKKHNNIKIDDWINILKKSIIPEKRLESFSIGFYNWFCKINQAALPILIPQFENLIRYIIQNNQQDTSIYRQKESKQEEQSFKNNLDNEIIKNKLGKDLVFQFQLLLISDKKEGLEGFNIRNKIEHGLCDDEYFLKPECNYFVLLMLKLLLSELSL